MCGCLGYSSSVVSQMFFSKVESTEACLIYSVMCANPDSSNVLHVPELTII